MQEDLLRQQLQVCGRYGVPHVAGPPKLMVGISRRARRGVYPLNGLRHPPERDTTGWYLWAGEELGTSNDFFQPMHVQHLEDHCPEALPFLGLPPGWRFLIAPGYLDVWFDASLLDI